MKAFLNFVRLNYARLISIRLISLRKLHGLWEQDHLKRLLSYYDVDCVFDVGANYGQYALMLRSKAKYKGLIISFEPIPAAAAALRKLSAKDPLWLIEECALSKKNGEQEFRIMLDSQFSSLSEPSHEEIPLFRGMNEVGEVVRVRTETLDSAFRRLQESHKFKRPFLKMDTQGYDAEVIAHGKSVAKQFVGLQSELAVMKLYENFVDYRDALTAYEEYGFSLSALVPNNAGHFPLLVETDCIMVRSDLAEGARLVFKK